MTRITNQLLYFTDGSVYRESSSAECVFVSREATTVYRLSNGASTLQTELAAIWKALQHAHAANSRDNVTIITDSLSAINILGHTTFEDNIHLTTSIVHIIQQMRQQNRQVLLVWIPSHIGIPGNEAADAAANEGRLQQQVTLPVPLTLTNLRSKVNRAALAVTASQHRAEVLRESPSAVWYSLATGLQPPHVPPTMSRELANITHRLRLGFHCWEIINGDVKYCEYCENVTMEPLNHYLLECPATERVRTLANYQREATADPAHSSRGAPMLVRRLLECPEAITYMRFYPPPR